MSARPALDIVEFSSVEEPQRNSRQHTLAGGHFLPVHRGDDFVTPLKAHQEVKITAGAITALLAVPLLEIRQLPRRYGPATVLALGFKRTLGIFDRRKPLQPHIMALQKHSCH